jgi:hypothetical protein
VFFCTMGMCYLPFLLYVHLELKEVMIAWCSYCNTWSTTQCPPGHCSNGGQIQGKMEPINDYWLLLDLDAWFSKLDVQSAGEEGPIAPELYATSDLWCSTGKGR